jgi:long-subunit acyl-CoA synthetase (AMP-forming)
MSQTNVYHSPYPLPAIPHNQSVSQFLACSNPDDAHPDTVILADFDDPVGKNVTYGGLRHNAARDAAILRRRYGLAEAGIVCIYGFNSVAWASIAHATLWSGGCFW